MERGHARAAAGAGGVGLRSEEHTSELQSRENLVCRLLLEKKKLFVAHQPVATDKTRAVLPYEVPLGDATFNAARTALLARAIVSKRSSLLGQALRDRLHQPHRLHLYPWVEEVINVAEAAGAYGAAICGAGPSVFAFCAASQANRIANAMEEAHPLRGRALVTRITDKGMFRTL